jgi:hypothetical protein
MRNYMRTRGGQMLREWLRGERRSEAWLAHEMAIGTCQATINKWITGVTPEPSLRAAQAIERITGIDAAEWLLPIEQPSGPSLPQSNDEPTHKAC